VPIVRSAKPENGYLMIRNSVVRDPRLSRRARGVLVEILSHKDDWHISADALAAEGPEGRDAIREAFDELRAAGYLERRKHRGARGRITTEIVVYDVSQTAPLPFEPTPENPSSVPLGK
jgi:hypothetical protein